MTRTIADLLRSRSAEAPDAPMLRFGEETRSAARLDRRASGVAAGLLAGGLSPGDRVAILDRNIPEQFDILFGAAKAGLVTVPVNWRLAPEELAYVVEHAAARVLVIGAEFLEGLAAVRERLPALERVIVFGGADGFEDFETWLDRHPARDPRVPVDPGDTALQLYTSGTTGRPKGVMLTGTNLFTLIGRGDELWGLGEGSVSIVCLPLFHIGGIGWGMACMLHGGTALLMRQFDPAGMLAAIERYGATYANVAPAMLRAMVESPEAGGHDYASLRTICYGTAPIDPDLLIRSMRLLGCDFAQLYGLTETTSAITQLDPGDHDPDGPRAHLLRSAGRPYPWVETRIVDPSTDAPCGPGETGETGELWARSDQNMKGYWNDPEATAATITGDGWLKTGDAGYFDDNGYLFLTDRVKDMIVSGGENVYPAEIEARIREYPGVAETAVIGVPDDRWGETVKAVVVPEPGAAIDERELIDWLRARLAHYKCPTSVDVVAALPRNATGKILKRSLREPYWRGRSRRIG